MSCLPWERVAEMNLFSARFTTTQVLIREKLPSQACTGKVDTSNLLLYHKILNNAPLARYKLFPACFQIHLEQKTRHRYYE
jgi:hypothetical protein